MITTLNISGLHCPACEKLTEKRIFAISGVKTVRVNSNNGKAVIEADRNLDDTEINQVLTGLPYHAKNN
ncbi:MAG: Cation-transporting atpase [Candidatus Amesbacteria bacterium GW2011_GWA1_47_16]|uniref:HMA domain-containing protein n=5 Tax=Candidatus Amesiibacteriota TaxID=1752730 RepID=A0A1F4ZXV9_9BACT|nr:MAG: Cation-transporting atpase [Candidatus Amesbacteria bacterium GW2011_GWA1_47_16]KKU64432.1 MAG: Cation-transporting atpase [Candidatus Amesbacteria bacterium GW2011_GWC1_47_15]KKU97975.1 MAG: Cation-transporting atpase [Candidatus Amesbacteria bacterium GW2011_GWB1_48_13]OGC99728.1 MAG: hypothetical protein A2972_01845 [Candidatus Amesbacteria bacterium RIFCSPLOWO2_01_FULL_47_33]OGD00585.1 MAG: hypothetical protein A2701_04455 [Candidatus Amesbacteria bacterium RIFCSPHIGHO2_01_FULL_47_3